jgi:hypothetical protein
LRKSRIVAASSSDTTREGFAERTTLPLSTKPSLVSFVVPATTPFLPTLTRVSPSAVSLKRTSTVAVLPTAKTVSRAGAETAE